MKISYAFGLVAAAALAGIYYFVPVPEGPVSSGPHPAAATSKQAPPAAKRTSSPRPTKKPTKPTPSAPPPNTKKLAQEAVRLVDAYYLLEPNDTVVARRKRLQQAGMPSDIIATLNLAIGTKTCQNKLQQQQKLTMTPTVSIGSLKERQDNDVLLIKVPVIVQPRTQKGSLYPDTKKGCRLATSSTPTLTWGVIDGKWRLRSLVDPEMTS